MGMPNSSSNALGVALMLQTALPEEVDLDAMKNKIFYRLHEENFVKTAMTEIDWRAIEVGKGTVPLKTAHEG